MFACEILFSTIKRKFKVKFKFKFTIYIRIMT